MLQPVAVLPSRLAANVVARLKVLAELLTYRTDVPQEGRIRGSPGEIEMRLSTFPTLHGEKAVVRLFAGSGRFLRLADLGLPAEVHDALSQVLDETSGAGPRCQAKNCLTPRSGADCLNLDIRRQGFGPKPSPTFAGKN